MPTHLLALDANTSFATMIKQVLEDQGDYRVSVAASAAEGIELAARIPFDLAIVDMGLPDVSGADAIRGLRATRPSLAIIAIPFDTDSTDPVFRSLDAQGFLTKPFFIPDLADIVEEALARPVGGVAPPPRQKTAIKTAPETPASAPLSARKGEDRGRGLGAPTVPRSASSLRHAPPRSSTPEPARARPAEPTPPWLEDVSRAAQYLTTLTLQTAAAATLLTRGPRVIAYAGQFPKEEAEELARLVDENWTRDGGSGTLMRFIKLSATGSDYLLYATAATSDIVLAMAFQAETPVSMIRQQARKIAESLLQPPATLSVSEPQPAVAGALPTASTVASPSTIIEPRSAVAATSPAASIVAPPLSGGASTPAAQSTLRPESSASPGPSAATTGAPELSPELSYEWVKPISEPKVSSPAPAPSPALPPEMVVGVGLQLPAESAPPGLARTPHGLYNLTYTIVWLPKLPKTRLIGDITVRLDEWIRNIALAYDWRVERLEVRADCIVLVAMCPPATAPERVVNILKRSTSERVFAEFPRPAADHPARDFWAPGYLLLGAGQTLTPQQVGDYIAYTRREQGLNR